MSRTEAFRAQHQRILEVADELGRRVDQASSRAPELRRLLAQLAGKLSVHLAMEDETLYPRLLAHAEARVSSLARLYVDEMGGLAESFRRYVDRWPTPAAIAARPAIFADDTRGVLEALRTRIAREDRELYPLVDSLR
jgi:hypothetical protein